MDDHPHIADAPGLIWRRLKSGWSCHWQARSDLVHRGYRPTAVRLWPGPGEPDEITQAYISDQCQRLQDDMLTWGRGGVALVLPFDGTVAGLVAAYQTDQDSAYRKLRYRTRLNYDSLCRILTRDCGKEEIANIKGRLILRWYEQWSKDGHITQAHSLMTMFRTITSFGSGILDDKDCERLASVLHRMRFKGPGVRKSVVTAEQVIAIRAKAHQLGLHSIALAQAIQFELILRQRDVIGEWVPIDEPGMSDVTGGGMKWLRGVKWDEIDSSLVLCHKTSKRDKILQFDLRLAPMVMEELGRLPSIPTSGPVIVREATGFPWNDLHFRRAWRSIADACGIPKNVWNMDSRAGAISEGRKAGADLNSLRHAATHSDISTTQRYDRDELETVSNVMRLRAKKRTKSE